VNGIAPPHGRVGIATWDLTRPELPQLNLTRPELPQLIGPVGCQNVAHAADQWRSPSPVITALFDVRRGSRHLLAHINNGNNPP
jgi:hypothetical protein